MVSADLSLLSGTTTTLAASPWLQYLNPKHRRNIFRTCRSHLSLSHLHLPASICLSFGSSLSFTIPATLDFWVLWYISFQSWSYMWDTYFPSAHFQIRTVYLWLLWVAGGTSTLTHCSFSHPKRKHRNQLMEVFAFLLEMTLLHVYMTLNFAFAWKAWV